jgi:crossover junction endodeoxyribonuclease RusA
VQGEVHFVVPGTPRPKGSAKWIARGGKAVPLPNDRLVAWVGAVAAAAQAAMVGRDVLGGPVCLVAFYMFQRPKAHYRTGRYANELKPTAPTSHTKTPDTSKLVRALEDALTGVVWVDDRQVCWLEAHKVWVHRTEQAQTMVWVRPLGEHDRIQFALDYREEANNGSKVGTL